jgi:Family of unknown function (DUF6232)
MAEENIYSDNNVSITTARIIVSGTTYALRNITSVKMTATAGNPIIPVALIIVGGIVLSVGVVLIVADTFSSSLQFLIAGGLLFAGGLWCLRVVKPTFPVTIASSSGEIRALSSRNRPYIETIVGAINEAIIRYR